MRRNQITLPVQFDLLGYTWKVSEDPKLLTQEADARGICQFGLTSIRVAPLSQISKQEQEHTLLHELVHAILNAMGQTTLNDDEAWVDTFSAMLHQILTSADGLKIEPAQNHEP
jgi:hypothetical protein